MRGNGWGVLIVVVCAGCADDSPLIGPEPNTGAGGTGQTTTSTSTTSTTTGPTSQAGYISGTRLRAKYLEGSDGSRVYTGLHDTELGKDCWFYPMSDGTRRCLPQPIAHIVSGSGYYSDPGCSNPLIVTAKGCGTPAVALMDLNYCTPTYAAYVVSAPASTAYVVSGLSCVEYPELFDTYSAYFMGPELPLDDYVGATEQVE